MFTDDAVESVEDKTKNDLIKKNTRMCRQFGWMVSSKQIGRPLLSIEKTKTLFIWYRPILHIAITYHWGIVLVTFCSPYHQPFNYYGH